MEISSLHQLFLTCTGPSTDTRKIRERSMFFALKGDHFNGNEYAENALELGASYAIVDEKKFVVSERTIFVNNVLIALQELARYHRRFLKIPIIALTGSNGKTTTKELIHAVISSTYKTVATKGNLNNHIGVPLTLLSMHEKTEIGVVEMGANHQKEIDFLCDIAEPDYGYITNIGKAHLEGFGGIEGVLKGKTEMYRHLKKNNKFIFLNLDDTTLRAAAKGMNTFTFSKHAKSDLNIQLKDTNPFVTVNFENQTISSNLTGAYNFNNIAAAIAIGRYFDVATSNIKTAIESYSPANNRSQILQKGEHTIVLDAYNANPSSMEVAILNFDLMDYTSKSIFLGDMFELGVYAAEEHQKIADLAVQTKADHIYLIGEHFFQTTNNNSRVQKFNSFDDFISKPEQIHFNQGILIKGSRGMQLERILDYIH